MKNIILVLTLFTSSLVFAGETPEEPCTAAVCRVPIAPVQSGEKSYVLTCHIDKIEVTADNHQKIQALRVIGPKQVTYEVYVNGGIWSVCGQLEVGN